MTLRKHLAGFVVFVTIFGGSVLALRALTGSIHSAATINLEPIGSSGASSVILNYETRYISLDFVDHKAYTMFAINVEDERPLPSKVWVRTYFFVPDDRSQRIWSTEAVEHQMPSLGGERVEVLSVAKCDWCNSSDAPTSGYHARVIVSPRSASDTYLRDEEINRELTTATPVVVQADRNTR